MHVLALIGCVLLCGLGYRIRGGLLGPLGLPGQASRLCFAVPASVTALMAGAAWWQAAALVPLWFIGETLPLFSSIDLGANEGSFWTDFAKLAGRGVLGVALPAALAWWCGYSWPVLLAFGALMGPAYVLARAIRWAPPVYNHGLGTAVDFPPRGELITGWAFGAGMALAVVL